MQAQINIQTCDAINIIAGIQLCIDMIMQKSLLKFYYKEAAGKKSMEDSVMQVFLHTNTHHTHTHLLSGIPVEICLIPL